MIYDEYDKDQLLNKISNYNIIEEEQADYKKLHTCPCCGHYIKDAEEAIENIVWKYKFNNNLELNKLKEENTKLKFELKQIKFEKNK